MSIYQSFVDFNYTFYGMIVFFDKIHDTHSHETVLDGEKTNK